MLIAGDPSGDTLAAELVRDLRQRVIADSLDSTADVQPLRTALAPRFFGAGGPAMAAAGVELAFDLTQHSVIGLSGVLRAYPKFRRMFYQLLRLAIEQQPDVIIGVDFSGFNLRFGKAIKDYVRKHRKDFAPWNPKLVQFVLPQVWASRPGRAFTLAENYDLLLAIFPFEKAWYAQRVPGLKVEFAGHPMVDRLAGAARDARQAVRGAPCVVLLPGSRLGEVQRHCPLIAETFAILRREIPELRGKMILPTEALAQVARASGLPAGIEVQVGGITAALAEADLAITKSGTVTMECAMFGVPAVVFYKVSVVNEIFFRAIITVKYVAMPNLLAGEAVFPEFIQQAATAENLSRAALDLLRNEARRQAVKAKLAEVIAKLGTGGATARAADAIARLPA